MPSYFLVTSLLLRGTSWLLTCYCIVTAFLFTGYYLVIYWLLPGYCMVTLWLLPCYWLITSWLLPGYYLAAACLLPGYFLLTAWLLPDYFLVTIWLLPGYFLVLRFAERRNLLFLRLCHRISNDLYPFTQCSSARFTSCCSVSCSVNPDLHGSRKFITVYTTSNTYTKMSFRNRKREVRACLLVAFQWGGHLQKYFHVDSWQGVIFQIIGFGIVFTISRRSCYEGPC